MNLLFVIDCLGSGGAQRQMVNLAIGLTKKGHNVEFFVYYPELNHFKNDLDDNGIILHNVTKKRKLGLNVIIALRKLIRTEKYDAVLSFLDTPNFYSEISTIGLNIALIVSERSTYPNGKLPLKLFLLQQLHRLASLITVNSGHQEERMLKEFPWMQGKLIKIYNGVDLNKFNYHPARICKAKTELKIIAIGSMSANKNAKALIEASWRYINKYGHLLKVTWVGVRNVSVEGVKSFDEANYLLNNYGLTNIWTWAGEHSNIPELLNYHDVLVHSSFYEGLPNVVCESLACGRPVFASNVCEHPRIIVEGETGYLFDPKRPDELADKLHKYYLLSNFEKAKMSQNARTFAEKHFSAQAFVSTYENTITASINKRTPTKYLKQHI